MRLPLTPLLFGLGLFFLAAAATPAPAGDWASYNYSRASRHFLNSPALVRTFSSISPGYETYSYTPFGYQSFYVEPGYEKQWITPRGYENFSSVPGYGGGVATPFGYSEYYVPGYPYRYSAPPPPARRGPP